MGVGLVIGDWRLEIETVGVMRGEEIARVQEAAARRIMTDRSCGTICINRLVLILFHP